MSTILITNDDGAHDPGLLALKRAVEKLADVIVLAPERNRSAVSHQITMHKPLRVKPVVLADGFTAHTCSGSPADCVRLAAGGVLGVKPDLVISGINAGHNMGVDIYYSGTVACAREATINGLPAIAFSSVYPHRATAPIEEIWAACGKVAATLVSNVLQNGLPRQTLLNVNLPGLPYEQLKGLKITRIGSRSYKLEPEQRADPFGQAYYWPMGDGPFDDHDEGTDVGAVAHGYVSITPITLDATNYDFMDELSQRVHV